MAILLLFILILVLTFAVILVSTRPSAQEKRLQQRLSSLSSVPGLGEENAELLKSTNYSDIPLLDVIFQRLTITKNLKTLIVQSDSKWTVGRLVAATVLVFVSAAWLPMVWLPSLTLRLVLASVLASVPYFTIRIQRDRRFRRFEVILPEALDLMTRGLRAGHSVSSTIEMVGQEVAAPVGAEFKKCFEQQNFGLPFREAIEDLARRIPIADLQFLVTAILVQKESGGNLAEVLDKAGVVIRERIRIKGELAIYTAQGKLTGWILGMLPFVMFVLLSMVNSQYTAVLIHDPLGQKLVIVGLVLMAAGFLTIRKIVDIKV
ncbi:MAG TPA: type II secretion system F family protein [Candidatus Angelobacter sp.]|nr:type II secretion system F family protein [Candidatus Angelobacter sp.]